ncbi:Uncharacterised protein [Bacteroides xylanisolvens]|nr:Uncharacterised protein [Bacteroides xylanisolvens]
MCKSICILDCYCRFTTIDSRLRGARRIRLGQILLCPVLDGCGDLPIFHILPSVLADFIGDQLVCLVLDLRCLGSDDTRCRVVDVDSFIVDDFRSFIRDHLCLIGQRFFRLDRDILRFHHDLVNTLFEGRAFSRSIFHRGADLFSRHIQRACGSSIARRSIHAFSFSCFDREICGVGTILIRYAELIRIDAARGDLVAIDLRRGRTTIRDCRCIIFKGGSISIGRHFRVVYLIGNAGACCIGDGILCIVYDIFPDNTYRAIRGCNGHVVLVLMDNSRVGAISNSRLDAVFLLIDHGRHASASDRRINRYTAIIIRMDTADASFRTIGHGASQVLCILPGRCLVGTIGDFRGSRFSRLGFRILQSTFDEVISGFISPSDVLSFFFCSFDADISSGLSCFLGFRISTISIIHFVNHAAGSIAIDIRSRGGLCTTYIGSLIASDIVNLPTSDGISLTTGNDIFLTASHGIGLFPRDVDILIPCHICFLTVFEVFGHFSFYSFCLGSLHLMDFIAADGGREITAYGIRHIAAGVVHDIHCIVCDRAILSGIGDIFRCLLRLRGRARRILDFRHRRILGIDLMILILPILVLDLEAVLCRSDFRIGLVTVLVSHIAIDTFCGLRSRARVAVLVNRKAIDAFFGLARIGAISLRIFDFGIDTICLHIRAGFCPVGRVALLRIGFAALFRMGKLALRDHTALFHLSDMSDTVCGNRSSASMNRTIRVRIGVFHGNLVRLELALDFEILLHGHILFECCFAFHGQFVIEFGLAGRMECTCNLCILSRKIAPDSGISGGVQCACIHCSGGLDFA